MRPKLKLNVAGFQKSVKRFLDRADQPRELAGRRLFFQLIRLVILHNPVRRVGGGRSRGGWGAAAEAAGVNIPLPPGGTAEAYAEGRALSEYREETSGATIRFVAVNNVEYIEYLEDGSSAQAPYGMVRISMLELERHLSGGDLPRQIQKVYEDAWRILGLKKGTTLRAGNLAEALGDLRAA